MSRELEAPIQVAIVEYLRLALPGALVFAIPNGGLRSKREAARMVRQGVLPGVADLQILGPWEFTAFIEVKPRGRKLEPAQERFRDYCHQNMIPWACCRSIDDAYVALVSWGLKPRLVPQETRR